MRKLFFLSALFLCFSISAFCQSETIAGSSKAVYGELGGSGLIFSANFDMRFKGYKGLGFRAGIGGAGGTGGGIVTVPVGLNFLAGKAGPHYFEAGATVTLVSEAFDISDETGSGWFAFPHIGYRYTKPTNSFNGRIVIGPFITGDFMFFPFAGLSAGYTF